MTDDDGDFDDLDIDSFLEKHVAQFRAARADTAKLAQAINAYLDEGEELELSPHELRDYFDISSPGLLESAGFSDSEIERGGELFEKLSAERYDD
jgi:hypothetical protein